MRHFCFTEVTESTAGAGETPETRGDVAPAATPTTTTMDEGGAATEGLPSSGNAGDAMRCPTRSPITSPFQEDSRKTPYK